MNKRKIILLDDNSYSTDILELILEKNGFLYISMSLERFLVNLYNYHKDVILVPERFIETIDNKIHENTYISHQDAILISTDNRYEWRTKKTKKALNILEHVNIFYSWNDEIKNILNRHIQKYQMT